MIGDRVGRKFVLTSTVLLMGVSSTLIGAYRISIRLIYLAPALLVISCVCFKGWAQAPNRPVRR